jgi:hypothetical protein
MHPLLRGTTTTSLNPTLRVIRFSYSSFFLFATPNVLSNLAILCCNISSYHLIQSRSTNSASWLWGLLQSIAVSGGAALSAPPKSTLPAALGGLCYSGEQGYVSRVTATKQAGNVEDPALLLIDET